MVHGDSTGEDSTSDEEFVFGLDFSKIDVANVEFDNDTMPAAVITDPTSSTDSGSANRCCDLVEKRLVDLLSDDRDSIDGNDLSAELFEWALGLGANLDHLECRSDNFGGRGLYACSDRTIASGDVLATLPRSLRIGQNHARRKLGLAKDTADLSALSLMILDAMAKSEIYARCLPQQCPNAVFMSPQDQAYWTGCGEEYKKAISKIRDQAHACVQYIEDCVLKNCSDQSVPAVSIRDDSAIWWAIAMVQSRTHGFGSNKSRWMTPIFDFCNHSATPNCRLEGDAEGNLMLKANHDIERGEEITIDYQVPDDSKLVATYGFSLKHPGPVKT